MSANQATFPIATMARVLGVSEAGYYAWRHRSPSARALADAVLLKRVRTIHASSRETYGAPRVHAALRADGGKHGRKRVARLGLIRKQALGLTACLVAWCSSIRRGRRRG
jgi:putative transposase